MQKLLERSACIICSIDFQSGVSRGPFLPDFRGWSVVRNDHQQAPGASELLSPDPSGGEMNIIPIVYRWWASSMSNAGYAGTSDFA